MISRFRALKTMVSCVRFSPPPTTGRFFSLKTLIVEYDASFKRQTKEKEEDAEPKKGKKKFEDGISLSGLLNLVDGLWSSCGEEKIIIFTTNHKEKLDPALLMPGRMDVHILMDNCTPIVLKKLVSLYLKLDDHVLFDPIEKLVLEVSATPAEVTQQLMASKDADIALKGLLEFLETKKMDKEEDTKVDEDGETEDAEPKEAEPEAET